MHVRNRRGTVRTDFGARIIRGTLVGDVRLLMRLFDRMATPRVWIRNVGRVCP